MAFTPNAAFSVIFLAMVKVTEAGMTAYSLMEIVTMQT